MQLYDNPGRATLRSDVGGLELPAVTVIARCLEVLKERTLAQTKEQQGIELQVAKVLWVLTVPAIWPESSKQLMRRAAHMAGLIESEVSARLVLALEPECAAIHCQETLDFLKKGVRYAVVDCGGGTIDTTVYVVETAPPRLDLQELHRAGGGGWGSTRIDAKFVEFLRELLGEHHECLQDNSFALFELLTNVWEERKVRFGREQLSNPSGTVSINITAILKQLPSVSVRSSVEAFNVRHPETPLRVVGSSNLKIPVSLMRSFYEDVLGHIRRHVSELLATVKDVRYLLLVGGFADSALLQDMVKEEAERRGAELIIPPRPWLAIVLGAVQVGLRPHTISLRRARLTYGIQSGHRFVSGRDPEHHKAWDEELQEFYVNNVFSTFVTVNEALPLDHEVEHVFYPRYDHQAAVQFSIVGTGLESVSYTDEPGVNKLGRVSVAVPSGGTADTKPIKCTMKVCSILK